MICQLESIYYKKEIKIAYKSFKTLKIKLHLFLHIFGQDHQHHLINYHMLSPKKDDSNNDSDNDEGFVVNTIEINQKERPKIIITSTERPNDYQPRYLNSNLLIKKQLPELITSYPHFPNEDLPSISKISRRRDRENFSKIQERTFPNKNYQLVYQRTNKKIASDSLITQHNVDLTSTISYAADNYSILKPWDLKQTNQQLTFESRFQCGNLLYAYKSLVVPNHYVLYLQNDTNTKGYNKWFYFAVKNKSKYINYTFSIVNFRKNLSFVKQGLKPCRFSLKEQEATGNGWSKCGRTNMYRSKIGEEQDIYMLNQHYTLSFEVNFEYENDTNFFSLLPPYSYSKMMTFLEDSLKMVKERPDLNISLKTISYSLSNTQVPYLTISSPEPSKKNIILLARQHPGEVWSSFFAETFIKELLRDSFPEKDWLLNHYTFRIFPMINVDGVIYGNFRCDLGGTDMNRCWKDPNKLLHPHLVAIKEEIKRLATEEEVISCFDLHAHSKQYNIFAYCCKTDNHGRLLPLIISQMSSIFYFPFCTFGISRFKQTTARAVIYNITKAPDVLTFQSSFLAASNPYKIITPSVFIAFSNALLKALKSYYSKDQTFDKAEEDLPKALAEVASLRSKNRQKYSLKSQSGSDSEPEIDEIALTEKIGKIIPKCPMVEEAFGLKEEEKPKIEQSLKPKKQKRQKFPQQLIHLSKNTLPQQPVQLTQVEKPPPITLAKPRSKSNNTTANKFLERLMQKKQDRMEERNRRKRERQKGLRDTIQPSFNQSLQLRPERRTLSKFLEEEFKSTFRVNRLRYQMEEVHQKKEEEFPLLCVLSDSKREAHLQKLKRIHPPPPQTEKTVTRYQPTLVVNKKMDTMQRLRQRQKKSSDLVSSLWKETLGYDQGGPITHIFYGGP